MSSSQDWKMKYTSKILNERFPIKIEGTADYHGEQVTALMLVLAAFIPFLIALGLALLFPSKGNVSMPMYIPVIVPMIR